MRHKVKILPGKGILDKQKVELNTISKIIKEMYAENYMPQQTIVHPSTYAKLHAHFYVDPSSNQTMQFLPVK